MKVYKLNLFFKELMLFGAVQALGLYVARIISSQPEVYGLTQNTAAGFSWFNIVFLIVVGFVFVMLVRHHSKIAGVIFKIVFILAIFSGTQVVLGVFMGAGLSLLVSLLIVLAVLFFSRVWVHNLTMILALAGIGTLFGLSLQPLEAIVLLALLSFYDIWAVYKTKHMIQLAEGMIRAGAISGVIIPPNANGLLAPTKSVMPGGDSMILGSGDLIFPLVLSAAVIKTSLTGGIIVGAFSAVGLLVMHLLFVNQTERKPMAALPPIATATILGYLVFLLL